MTPCQPPARSIVPPARLTRRHALHIALASLFAGRLLALADEPRTPRVWMPHVSSIPPGDAPLLGPPGGTVAQGVAWLAPRADPSYTDAELNLIVERYRQVGGQAGMDWFLALAQCCHETGSLTSFWSLSPQHNPAGIGVTGEWRAGAPTDPPPEPTGWAYNTQRQRWERGISFATWADHAIPAHLGRLLAYALTDSAATPYQRTLIDQALAVRPLPEYLRSSAPTICGLNGRWAVPGTDYGQRILALAARMRAEYVAHSVL